MKKLCIPFLFISFITAQNLYAQHEEHQKDLKSEYVGQEQRTIKSLSEKDVEELKAGKGWGFAKAAELNGIPGPLHLLEMKEEIVLTEEQIKKIKVIFKAMKAEAITFGNELVSAEKKLNIFFAEQKNDQDELKEMLMDISEITGELRFVHLNAHLKSLKILTKAQVNLYNELRGYTSQDPCENIPEGHNPEMWKRHNNCSE